MAEERPESGSDEEIGNAESGQPDPAADASEPVSEPPAEAEAAVESASEAAETIRRETSDDEDSPGDSASEGPSTDPSALNLPDFEAPGGEDEETPSNLHMLDDIDLQVKIELGRTRMYVEDVLRLNEDSVVELDKAAGDPVDIYVNDRHVARGEVLVLNENFCVRISEIIHQPDSDEDNASQGGDGEAGGSLIK
ncbi:MAG: flagellar motor switch protein FliN [Phycisphaerales bacterium]|nr:MAG: flagellar motor switch protein FliN [Phycisphaerales bacterium]